MVENILAGKDCIACGKAILKTPFPGGAMEFPKGYLCCVCQVEVIEAQEPGERI